MVSSGGASFQPGEAEDPFNRVTRVRIDGAKIAESTVEELPRDAFQRMRFGPKKAADKPRTPRTQKVHPTLRRMMADRPADATERLIVTFRDQVQIPRFGSLAVDEPRGSAANRRISDSAADLTKRIQAVRAESYAALEKEFGERYGARVLDTFWLINAMLVEAPLSAVPQLTRRRDVMYVEPQQAGEVPPANPNPNDDVDNGRARIVSDPYFNLGQTSGWIGLLDTGLRFTHRQFNSPSHIDFRRDCVNGGADCNTGSNLNPNDDCWNHGTSSAAIITANARQGNAFRGVTGITLDSFKVYPTTLSGGACAGFLDGAAAVRGFQAAVAVLDRVIVAEMQGNGSDTSAISAAADAAFNAGAVIIAANGNNGPGASTVNTPANAHKVIGVGNFDVQTLAQQAGQSRGPAPDNRFKPDVQAPTNTETASNGSDTALRVFSGTSGATPYAAGAAALLRNFMRGSSFAIDPGQVYAFLILAGQQPYPFNNTSGAGRLRLPTDGWAWWGKVSVTNGATIDVPLNISGGSPNTLDGALWWPETPAQQHNDVDLSLIAPNGAVRASSISIPSVFERARVTGAVTPGTWKLRIRGFSVPAGPQTVYWAAHVRLA